MQDETVKGKRETITMAWRPRAAVERREPASEQFVEIEDGGAAVPQLPERRGARVVEEVSDSAFLKRMDNWRRTVYGLGSRGVGGSCCAAWAALYVAGRNKGKSADEISGPPHAIVTVDELDGWLVEAAVRSLVDFNQKQVLRLWYVRRYPEHWIKAKLMLRRGGLRLTLARAEANLQKVLDTLESPTKILSNNLHAGNDPRPESTDAPVGAMLTLE